MYKRLVTLSLLVITAIYVVGCSKDEEINTVMTDIHAVTDEVVRKVDASPNVAGVDDAQKYFDSKKADLKSRWDGIKGARGFQVSDETKKKLGESYLKDFSAIKGLELKHIGKTIQDPVFKSKLEKLIKDWEDAFRAE